MNERTYECKYFYFLLGKYCYSHKYFYFYLSNFLQTTFTFIKVKIFPNTWTFTSVQTSTTSYNTAYWSKNLRVMVITTLQVTTIVIEMSHVGLGKPEAHNIVLIYYGDLISSNLPSKRLLSTLFGQFPFMLVFCESWTFSKVQPFERMDYRNIVRISWTQKR